MSNQAKRRKVMEQAVRRLVASNIHEGRALTLKVLKAQRAMVRNNHRFYPIPRRSLLR
jgi:hypothetical protein